METYLVEDGQLVAVNTVETKCPYSIESLINEKVSLEERIKVLDMLIDKMSELEIKTKEEITAKLDNVRAEITGVPIVEKLVAEELNNVEPV